MTQDSNIHHSSGEEFLDPHLEERLRALQAVPARNPAAAEQGRKAFLERAEQIRSSVPQGVSEPPNRRLNSWMASIQNLFQRKVSRKMLAPVLSIIVALSMLFGGAAGVSAAQASLPGQTLWAVKTFSEDVRLGLVNDPLEEIQLQLQFSEQRMIELQRMLELGNTPPGELEQRIEQHMEQAMVRAVDIEDNAIMLQVLAQVRQQFQEQERLMTGLPEGIPPAAQASLDRIRLQTRDRLRLLDECLLEKDPDLIRTRLQDRDGTPLMGTPNGWEITPGPGAGQDSGSGLQYRSTPTPFQPGEQPTEPPQFGPGPKPTEAPAWEKPGSPATEAPQIGPGPKATDAPKPGPGEPPTEAPATNEPGPKNPEPTTTPQRNQGDGSGGQAKP